VKTSTAEEVKIQKIFNWLTENHFVPEDCKFSNDQYRYIRKQILNNISLPGTTITPIMERFLYTISSSKHIKNIVVFGSYYGYALSWLFSGGIDNQDRNVVGIDIDGEACIGANQNLMRISNTLNGKATFSVESQDALKEMDRSIDDHSIDLCFLDIDVNGSKKEYIDLLEIWKDKMSQGGIILAHDPLVDKFQEDFSAFHEFIKTNDSFSHYVTLPLDFCGIDLFKRT